jgi:hypothetical protein
MTFDQEHRRTKQFEGGCAYGQELNWKTTGVGHFCEGMEYLFSGMKFDSS